MKVLKTFKKDNTIFNKGAIFTGTLDQALSINDKIPNAVELDPVKPKRKRNKKA